MAAGEWGLGTETAPLQPDPPAQDQRGASTRTYSSAYTCHDGCMTEHVPVRELRERLADLLTAVAERREHVVITRRGRPAAVLVPPDEYAALEETLDVLGDPASLKALMRGLADDPAEDVDLDELRSELRERSG